MSLESFKESLSKLQGIIVKLQTNTGSAHQSSPVDQLLGVKSQTQTIQPIINNPKVQQAVKVQNIEKIIVSTEVQPSQINTTVQVKVVQKTEVIAEKVQQIKVVEQKKVIQTNNETKINQVKVQKPVKQEKKQAKKQDKKFKKQEKKQQKKEEQKKQEKKQVKQQQLAEPTIDDFAQIDIRVGNIVQCWKHPASQNLYCEKIDIGGQIRQIASGLQKYVPIQSMSGPVLVMANLKPRKLADFMSNGMVVANSTTDHSQVCLIVPQGVLGQRVTIEGFQDKIKQQKQPVLNPKKKILQKCLPKLKSDAEGFALWNGHKLKTSGGYIKCTFANGNIS